MQHLQELLNSTEVPLIYAFILGLLTAVSPCQFARNITAIGYISRDIQNPGKVFVNGLFYTLGNAVGYLSIGIILFLGASKFNISRALISYGNILVGIVLLLGGILMLDIIKIRFPERGRLMSWIQERRFRGNKSDSVLLGFILSLSFCPYNAALFFGMLIPMTISSIKGLYLPIVYSITTGLPVAIIAYLLAFSVSGIGTFYNKVRIFQLWFNRIVAVIFIITGIYYIYLFFLSHFFTS
ncbi:MAG: sulfite exporter TauE/SafE family protein [Bacteroidales bacterium]|jgi:cytochrome c biogenesis protein CcdA|nr:sulfite exporter TauE/SafE family protein [Bacteroidales bacterium]